MLIASEGERKKTTTPAATTKQRTNEEGEKTDLHRLCAADHVGFQEKSRSIVHPFTTVIWTMTIVVVTYLVAGPDLEDEGARNAAMSVCRGTTKYLGCRCKRSRFVMALLQFGGGPRRHQIGHSAAVAFQCLPVWQVRVNLAAAQKKKCSSRFMSLALLLFEPNQPLVLP